MLIHLHVNQRLRVRDPRNFIIFIIAAHHCISSLQHRKIALVKVTGIEAFHNAYPVRRQHCSPYAFLLERRPPTAGGEHRDYSVADEWGSHYEKPLLSVEV